MNRTFGFLWLGWLIAFLVVEAVAISSGGAGDTLTEWILHATDSLGLQALLVALWLWLGWHFLVEPRLRKREDRKQGRRG